MSVNMSGALKMVGIVGGLVLVAGCNGGTVTTKPTSGSGPTSTPTSSAVIVPRLRPGTPATFHRGADTWTVTVDTVTYRTTGCGPRGMVNISSGDPDIGDAYILLKVTYRVTAGDIDPDALDWKIKDMQGNTSNELGEPHCGTELYAEPEMQNKLEGIVPMVVKAGATHGLVIYSPDEYTVWATWEF